MRYWKKDASFIENFSFISPERLCLYILSKYILLNQLQNFILADYHITLLIHHKQLT